MNWKVLGVAGCAGALILVTSCRTGSSGTVQTLYVASTMQDGVGVGPMACLQVKEFPDAAYSLFYSPIAGFDYVPGFEYELQVEVAERNPVPADASKYIYTLNRVVSKKASGRSVESTWELAAIRNLEDRMVPPVHQSLTWFRLSKGSVSGNAGANNFFGRYELDGSNIRFFPAGSNMMMGTPELMAQETRFLKLLGDTVDYLMVGDELRLRNVETQVVITMKPRIEPALTSRVWNAVGVNNGKGGVTSLLQNTAVSIQFTDEGRVSGSSGCNSFSGGYETEGSTITFGPLAGTRKMCSEPEGIMEQEQAFLQALERSSAWTIQSGSLELRDADGALQVKCILEEQE